MFNIKSQSLDLFGRIGKLLDSSRAVVLEGLWGSSAPYAAANIGKFSKRRIFYITSHIDQADQAAEDLELFSSGQAEVFPGWEAGLPDALSADQIAQERLAVTEKLLDNENLPNILVAPIHALIFPVPSRKVQKKNTISLQVALEYDIEKIADWLIEHGYTRLDQVEQQGDFAIRGGIVDVYPCGTGNPHRLEFFGDELESIRLFDPGTLRAIDEDKTKTNIAIAASPEFLLKQQSSCLLEYLDPDTIICWHEPLEISELARTFISRLKDPRGLYPYETILRQSQPFRMISLVRFPSEPNQSRIKMDFSPLPRFETQSHEAIGQLISLGNKLQGVYVFCENPAEKDRLSELLNAKSQNWQDKIQLVDGLLARGFIWESQALACIANHEIFHRYAHRHRLRRGPSARVVDDFTELNSGDYVVHVNHGIGKFTEMKTVKRDGVIREFMSILYADNTIVNVPVNHLNLVQKYVGGFRGHPSLSKLGSKTWDNTKKRVGDAVTELAEEMLEVQAKRQAMGGIRFVEDTVWQHQLEESFIYQETEDQLITLRNIKSDMQKNLAMDRLICGDVGYGKTELAIRAAFKAVESGYQVAVLVPTTILAEQHYRTFRERLADFPLEVDYLSRFKKKSHQKDTIVRTHEGKIDILIGTHRILSKDIRFDNLGLIVIDEEQRFGVAHKELLKRMRATVDVLTMTATPIPRTLHMSLVGLRDISTLTSPPIDRRAIQTEVCKLDWKLVRNGIIRELNRDGQVFFVHNRVKSIESVAAKIRNTVPEARIIIGHGQMREHELENVMLKFIERKADVLVCTTIIESGVDIPTVNTIFINNADRFGLAELHQLRGRVGRYKYNAYAYLLLPPGRPVTPTASRRLRAIEEYSELGAGFRIAMRDLEIRGAGNILGPEQSGHIGAVGYEFYCQLLSGAVKKLKSQKETISIKTNLDIGLVGHIPKRYIKSERQRLQVYRQIAQAETVPQCEKLESDLKDIFGKIPDELDMLLNLTKLQILAGRFLIRSIRLVENDLIFKLNDPKACQNLFADSAIKPRFADPTEVHLRMTQRQKAPANLLRILFKLLT